MDGLDEVTGAVRAEPVDAGFAVELGRDRGQNLLDALPAILGAADHDGGSVARTFFTTGNAHADEGQVAAFKALEAAHRIAEVGIAGIDHDVAGREIGLQKLHLLIDRIAGLDHDDDRARRADGLDEIFHRFARNDLALEGACIRVEFLRDFGSAVENRDLVAFFSNIEGKVGAHDAETN
ncbi:hypothetical protein D3C80_1272250 [compost metagenome]